ncbi:MAG: AmmeMemoRadiSam system protein B, partial [Rhizobiales bacterium]|nr:AmmeMemoRadiSam system protein B [Hyphomicrobiales bacterium]
MRSLIALAVLLLAAVTSNAASAGEVIPSPFRDDRIFAESIATAEALDIPARTVSGLTVPHHLVAADL